MSKVRLFKHLVRLAQIAEELEMENPAAANLIDENAENLANELAPQEVSPEVSPAMFPKQSNPVIPYNQYETGETEEFTQKEFEDDKKMTFNDALEITEEVTGEDPDWSEGVLDRTEDMFNELGGEPITYTDETESAVGGLEPNKIGEEIFNEILPLIEKGASEDEINSEIDKKIEEKLGN